MTNLNELMNQINENNERIQNSRKEANKALAKEIGFAVGFTIGFVATIAIRHHLSNK